MIMMYANDALFFVWRTGLAAVGLSLTTYVPFVRLIVVKRSVLSGIGIEGLSSQFLSKIVASIPAASCRFPTLFIIVAIREQILLFVSAICHELLFRFV